jgi:hypothetical protein
MFINISDEINDEKLDKLIDAYNALPENDILHIYLNSNGGEYPALQAMSHIINLNAKRTILYAYNYIASCAFELFFNAKCKKRLIDGCLGSYHQSRVSFSKNEALKHCDVDDDIRADYMVNYQRKKTDDLCKRLHMTEAEENKIKTTNDGAGFTLKRMKEFLMQINLDEKK